MLNLNNRENQTIFVIFFGVQASFKSSISCHAGDISDECNAFTP